MKISITGTPGTGKTTVSEQLSRRIGLKYVSVNDLAREKDCIISHDKKRNSDIVDVKKLREETSEMDGCVMDGHLSHFLDSDMVFVLRCKPSELKKRLQKKGWDENKVQENVEAEISGVIEYEARDSKDSVYSLNTTEETVDDTVGTIVNIIEGGPVGDCDKYFDWMEREDVDF